MYGNKRNRTLEIYTCVGLPPEKFKRDEIKKSEVNSFLNDSRKKIKITS
jgi:hypothetical protein